MSALAVQTDAAAGSAVSKPMPMHLIIEAVATFYGIEVPALLSDRRHADLVRARHIVFWFADRLTQGSYVAIGRRFRRDHTTVMHGVRRIADAIGNDIELQRQCAEIEIAILAARDALFRLANTVPMQVIQGGLDGLETEALEAADEMDRADAAAPPPMSRRAARIIEAASALLQAQKNWALKRQTEGEVAAIAAMTRAANTLETLIEGDQS